MNMNYANGIGMLAILSWGSLGLLGKLIAEVPADQVLFFCFLIISVLGLCLCVIKFGARTLVVEVKSSRVWIGALALFIYHYLFLQAFHHAPAIEVSLLNYLWPTFVLLLGNLFFSLNSGIRGLYAAIIGFIGVLVLFDFELANFTNPKYVFGYGLALTGAIIWAIYSNLRRLSTSNFMVDVSLMCFISAVLAGCSMALSTPMSLPTMAEWMVIVILALGPAGGSFFLWDYALQNGNAALLAVLGYSAPLISTFILLFAGYGEPSLNVVVATGLIASAGLVTMKIKTT